MPCNTATDNHVGKVRDHSNFSSEAISYHYARDSLKDPSYRRFSFCCTSTTFGGSYPKTRKWPCLLTMFLSSAATPIKKSLKQPFRKRQRTWQNGAGSASFPLTQANARLTSSLKTGRRPSGSPRYTTDSRDVPSNHPPPGRPANSLH